MAETGVAEKLDQRTADAALAFQDVHTHYGASHILRGVSFRLGRGECVSLMGRNGMGKSTTLRTAMGVVRPSGGEVTHFGARANGRPSYRSATEGLAYVPEGRGIFPNLTVRENLVVAARPGRDGRRDWDLERVLELFPRLAERIDNWGNNLSGGEQQMLTIGRALMTNPDVLLLDEATEGLAPLIREEIWRVLGEIKRAGIACLVVDKNVKRLVEICDRHLLLVKGEIVFEGDGEALMADADFLHRHLGV
ncbi:MAG: ABC transporter ATP-binding protein [Alphaproteobacteria bacterium]|nr:ABC transporter ATP-binding protein [Alphaproteobacteria bacterium]